MELIATTRPPVACGYGAYLIKGGTRLRCGLLFVRKGTRQTTLTFRDPDTKQRIRVRLPKEAVNAKGHAKFDRIELEVLS